MRTRSTQNLPFEWELFNSGLEWSGVEYAHTKTVVDQPGLPAMGKFFSRSELGYNIALDGVRFPGSSSERRFTSFIPDGAKFEFGRHSVPQLYSTSELLQQATEMASSLNPANGTDARLSAVFELKEALPFLKLTGTTALSAYSNAYLGTDFGWKQFFEDLLALFLTAHAVDEFHRKYEKRAERSFTAKKGWEVRKEVHNLGPRSLQSYTAIVDSNVTRYEIAQKAVTFVRYSPGSSIRTIWGEFPAPPKTAEELQHLSTLDYMTAWNALPWSWLTDWLVPVSDYLGANSKSGGYHLSEFWYGLETEERVFYEAIQKPEWVSVSSLQGTPEGEFTPCVSRSSYQRVPSEPTIIPTLDILSYSKFGTLSALTARLLDGILSRRGRRVPWHYSPRKSRRAPKLQRRGQNANRTF